VSRVSPFAVKRVCGTHSTALHPFTLSFPPEWGVAAVTPSHAALPAGSSELRSVTIGTHVTDAVSPEATESLGCVDVTFLGRAGELLETGNGRLTLHRD